MAEMVIQLLLIDLLFSAIILLAYELVKVAWNLIFS